MCVSCVTYSIFYSFNTVKTDLWIVFVVWMNGYLCNMRLWQYYFHLYMLHKNKYIIIVNVCTQMEIDFHKKKLNSHSFIFNAHEFQCSKPQPRAPYLQRFNQHIMRHRCNHLSINKIVFCSINDLDSTQRTNEWTNVGGSDVAKIHKILQHLNS